MVKRLGLRHVAVDVGESQPKERNAVFLLVVPANVFGGALGDCVDRMVARKRNATGHVVQELNHLVKIPVVVRNCLSVDNSGRTRTTSVLEHVKCAHDIGAHV